MEKFKRYTPIILSILALLLAIYPYARPVQFSDTLSRGYSDLYAKYDVMKGGAQIVGPTRMASATPVIDINVQGLGDAINIKDGGTPVAQWNQTGKIAVVGVNSSQAAYVAVPTAVGSATPALFVNSAAGLSNLMELRVSGTPVVQVDKAGQILQERSRKITAKTAAYQLTIADSGKIFTNEGAAGNITYTLPSCAEGLYYTFMVSATQGISITPGTGDYILFETNAANDILACKTGGSSITLIGLDAIYWLPLYTVGTWNDVDG